MTSDNRLTNRMSVAMPPSKKAKTDGKTRNWVVVFNKNPRVHCLRWKEEDLPKCVTWTIGQLEEAPTTHHEHGQAFFHFSYAKTRSEVIKFFEDCDAPHVEAMRGKIADQVEYCNKDESALEPDLYRWNRGDMPKQGNRSDLAEAAEAILADAKEEDIALQHPTTYIRYHKGMLALRCAVKPVVERPMPKILFIWGPPGCLKSRYARAHFPDAYFANDNNNNWFDGYKFQKVIVFDDFQGKTEIGHMLKLLDFGKFQMPYKGGFVPIHADTFIFTTNCDPATYYDGHPAWLSRVEGDRYGSQVWDAAKLREMIEKKHPDWYDEDGNVRKEADAATAARDFFESQ